MASVISAEELKILKQEFDSMRKRVKENPEEAMRILQSAGIADKKGKLAARYRTKKEGCGKL